MGAFAEQLQLNSTRASNHPDIIGTLSGMASIDEAFKKFEFNAKKKLLSRVLNRIARPIKADIKALTPKGPTGNLDRSVATRVKTKVTGFIHWRLQFLKRRAPHAHWIEWGTSRRTWTGMAIAGRPIKAGKSLRAVPATWSTGRTQPQLIATRVFERWAVSYTHLTLPTILRV